MEYFSSTLINANDSLNRLLDWTPHLANSVNVRSDDSHCHSEANYDDHDISDCDCKEERDSDNVARESNDDHESESPSYSVLQMMQNSEITERKCWRGRWNHFVRPDGLNATQHWQTFRICTFLCWTVLWLLGEPHEASWIPSPRMKPTVCCMTPGFIMSFQTAAYAFSYTESPCQSLLGRSLDIIDGYGHVKTVTNKLQRVRNQGLF